MDAGTEAGIALVAAVVVLTTLAVLAKAIQIIPPGKVGVVYLFGARRRLIYPGMNLVHPYSRVKVVPEAELRDEATDSGGVLVDAQAVPGFAGRVRLDSEATYFALSEDGARLPSGARVRVVGKVREVPFVVVRPERSTDLAPLASESVPGRKGR